MLDSTLDLDEINIYSGSHVVMATDTLISDVKGYDNATIHVMSTYTLRLGTSLTANTFMYPDSTLNLAWGSHVELGGWIFVKGNLSFDGGANVKVNGNLILQSQPFTAAILEIADSGNMTIYGDNTFNLNTPDFRVNGIFQGSKLVNISGLENFEVGRLGVCQFDPVTQDMYLGKTINIQGQLILDKSVSVVQPCEKLEIGDGGSIHWPTPTSIVLECESVNINGTWHAGTIDYRNGIILFQVIQEITFNLDFHMSSSYACMMILCCDESIFIETIKIANYL